MRTFFLVAIGAFGLFGCSQETVSVPVISFERPGAMSFGCLDVAASSVVPLADCAETDESTHRLLGFVAQTSRGELATVDLTTKLVVDLDSRVPGFTFARTGEVPIAVVTPPVAPGLTYVANYGSRTIESIPTARLHPDIVDTGLTPMELQLPGAPTALVASPDGAFLYVAIPTSGVLLEIALVDGVMGSPREIELRTGAIGVEGPEASADEYKLCSDETRLSNPAAQPAPAEVLAGGTASPEGLFIDEEGGRLLIADSVLPLVHIVDLADTGATVTRDPYNLGAPTRDVVATPAVPESIRATTGSVRFGYAIDAVDGSVLAFDAMVGSSTEGALLGVSSSPRVADRLALPAGVRTLEVLSPGYPGDPCSASDSAAVGDAKPERMRGVFLSVGLNDGTLRIVDVHDLDATCRGGVQVDAETGSCDLSQGTGESEVFIRRHRPRIAEQIERSVRVEGGPRFTLNGSVQSLLSTGAADREGYPALAPWEDGCPAGQQSAFPSESDEPAVVCAMSDPWVNRPQTWFAGWEGLLPNSDRFVGNLEGGEVSVFGAPNLCSLGTLDEVTAEAAIPGYLGDILVVTSVPDDERAECAPFAADSTGRRGRVAFSIAEAFADRVVLGASLGAFSQQEVAACFGAGFAFDVRSQGAYTVSGSYSGLTHGVRADAMTGRCEVVESVNSQGRALPGQPFNNGFIAFELGEFDESAPPEDNAVTGLSLVVGSVPAQLGQNVGAAPAALRYLGLNEKLYSVDGSGAGLVEIDLDGFKQGTALR